jgi:hypothetical protein
LLVEATLQKYLGPPALYCPSSLIEEQFGTVKFEQRWIGRQTDYDLQLLARARDASRDFQSFGPDDSRGPPIFVGPPGANDVADAIDRALRRRHMLAKVREDIEILNVFGDAPNLALSKLPDEEFHKLEKAREIARRIDCDRLVSDPDLQSDIANARALSERRSPQSEITFRPRKTVSRAPPPPPMICPGNHSAGKPGPRPGSHELVPPDTTRAKAVVGRSFGTVSEPTSNPKQDEWLKETLAYLLVCREVREVIGWQEVVERIDANWLRLKGFGPSTPIDIGALRQRLISEGPPRTSGPPKSLASEKLSSPGVYANTLRARDNSACADRRETPFVVSTSETTSIAKQLADIIKQSDRGPNWAKGESLFLSMFSHDLESLEKAKLRDLKLEYEGSDTLIGDTRALVVAIRKMLAELETEGLSVEELGRMKSPGLKLRYGRRLDQVTKAKSTILKFRET